MLLVLVAAVIGYVVAGWVGAVLGAGLVMGIGVLMHALTPKDQRETMHEWRMRTDQDYFEQQADTEPR